MAATTTLPFMNLDLRRLGLARAAPTDSVKEATFSPLNSSRSRGVNFQTAQDTSLINIVTTADGHPADSGDKLNNSLRRLIQSTSSGGGGATPSVGGEQRQLKALNDIKKQFDEKIMRFDMQIQEYLKLGNKLSDFLKVLKEREALIIDYFYKCFNFRNSSSSVRNSGFGTSV
jgi:hypothetical protein